MNTDCPHLFLKRTRSGAGETDFYKCAECKRNFTAEPLTIKVSYPQNEQNTRRVGG